MKLYFYSKQLGDNLTFIQKKIVDYLKSNGVLLVSNLTDVNKETVALSFENMNGLVIEGRESVDQAGYLTALALSQNKPILYLLAKGSMLPDQLRSLLEDKKLKKMFLLKFYNDKNLAGLLQDFLDMSETGEFGREKPSIKFTLRFAPRVERFLTWKAIQAKISKADYLRKLVDEAIKNDEGYQSQLKKQKPESESTM